jgi:hypothetical protein
MRCDCSELPGSVEQKVMVENKSVTEKSYWTLSMMPPQLGCQIKFELLHISPCEFGTAATGTVFSN